VTLIVTRRVIASTVKTFDGSSQLIDFAFVSCFVALGLLEGLKDLFHFVQNFAKFVDDMFDILNGFMNGRTMLAIALLILARVGATLRQALLLRRLRCPSR
jgi:hypothetical protein